MKLIDLLVQELPKCGGWPEKNCDYVTQDADGQIFSWVGNGLFFAGGAWCIKTGDYRQIVFTNTPELSDDYHHAIITRKQYEAALAASQKVEWDGEGLPPVGCEIEVNSPRHGWTIATVTAITDSWLIAKYSDGVEFAGCHRSMEDNGAWTDNHTLFRHIRSEADKKREIGVTAIALAMGSTPFIYGERMNDGRLVAYGVYELYDKIAAGEVAGIRIE